MENKRAFFLINKSDLREQDKKFLVNHLEHASEFVFALQGEISYLKDIIDSGKYLDIMIQKKKQEIVELIKTEKNSKELLEKLLTLLHEEG